MSDLTPEQLKRQAVFRMAIFFLITIIIGFIASDVNMLSSQQEIIMFQISEQTKAEAVAAMKVILGEGVSDESIEAAFEEAVAIVKKQFGM